MKPPGTYSFEEITPAKARELLANAHPNRGKREAHSRTIAKDIEMGQFHVTHQGIALDISGRMFDGQHRCEGIVLADKAQWMWVYRGISREAIAHIDTHARRTDADAARFLGHQFTTKHIALARRLLIPWDQVSDKTLTRTELINGTLKHMEAIQFARQCSQCGYDSANVRAPVAAAWYTRDRARLLHFLEVLTDGVADGAHDSAAIRLRQTADAIGRSGNAKSRYALFKKSTRAVAAFLNHETLSKLYDASSEQFPLPER